MLIITDKYLGLYKKHVKNIDNRINMFKNKSKNLDLSFLIESYSVFSSNIEWNTLDLNSFMNAKMNKVKTRDVEEIQSLVEAYKFAQNNKLNEENFLKVHYLLSSTILTESRRWTYRNDKIWVFWKHWLIYLAIEAEFVIWKMKDLFKDIELLLKKELSHKEVFYYTSMIHLIFVHIHPFTDWNGRTARLLEKWFLASKLWKDFWKLESERYYKDNKDLYYKNINLWVNYYELNYDKCLNFLLMLPKGLDI